MIEEEIVHFLNKTGNFYIDKVSIIISNNLFIIFLFSLIIFICLYFDEKRFKKLFVAIIIALSFHLIITEMFFKEFIRNLFNFRIRPYMAYPNYIIPLGEKLSNSSFPSGHISALTAFLSVLVYNYRRTKIYFKLLFLSILFIVLISFSRMHNGMHYPSDIIAGIVLGICYGILGIWVSKKIFN